MAKQKTVRERVWEVFDQRGADTPSREVARIVGCHHSTVVDAKRTYREHRIEVERQAAKDEEFSFLKTIPTEMHRVHPEARGVALALIQALDRLVRDRDPESLPRVDEFPMEDALNQIVWCNGAEEAIRGLRESMIESIKAAEEVPGESLVAQGKK